MREHLRTAEELDRAIAAPRGAGWLGALTRATRRAYASPPDEATEARHIEAIVESVRTGEHTVPLPVAPSREVTGLRRWAPRLAGGTAAAALAMSGLAYAGVPGVPNPVAAVVEAATEEPVAEEVPLQVSEGAPERRARTAEDIAPPAPSSGRTGRSQVYVSCGSGGSTYEAEGDVTVTQSCVQDGDTTTASTAVTTGATPKPATPAPTPAPSPAPTPEPTPTPTAAPDPGPASMASDGTGSVDS